MPPKNERPNNKPNSPDNGSSANPEAKKANKTADASPPAKATPAPVAAAPKKSGSGFGTTVAVLALGVSAAASYGVYWTSQQMQAEKNASAATIATLQQQLKTELSKSQEALQNELNQSTDAIKSEVSQTQQTIQSELASKTQELQALAQSIETTTTEKIAAAEANLTTAQAELGKANSGITETKKRQESLEVSIDGLYNRMGNTSRDWVIAEADYLLKVANHRLQLEQDVTTSIQALTLADKRINSLDEPALNEVRNVIAQELVALETLVLPDQAGVSMQLTELQSQVDQLPLQARTLSVKNESDEFQADDAMKVESWEALPLAIFDVLKSLVSVTHLDKPMEPLLSPEQVNNLHENLKLKLEQSRIVLLRGDQSLYDSNMTLAINWTEQFFNTEEVATKKFIDSLNYLKGKPVTLKTPDISSSLRALRKVAKRLEMNIPSLEKNAQNELSNESSNVAMN